MSDGNEILQDDMKEIVDDFLVETDELLRSLDNNLVKLESTPSDLNLLNEIFRAAHTIKGTSSFLGFEQVTSLTHKMEDVLNKLRKAEMVVTAEVMDILLESLDLLKVLIEHVRGGEQEDMPLEGILARLAQIQEIQTSLVRDASAPKTVAPAATTQAVAAQTPAAPIEEVVTSTGPAAAESPLPAAPAAALAAPTEDPSKTKAAPKKGVSDKKPAGDQTIRVDVDRLDSLMNLMGELVLSRNSLIQTIGRFNGDGNATADVERLNQAAATVNYITTELQMAVMKMRMQPIGKVFSRFPRLVRDLSRDSGKQIDLIMSGEETELDKSVIEEIGDPLVHIIRNSCDHGIEMPDARTAKGKPAKGSVHLTASQEGSNIVIRIQDDGKGLDIVAIRNKAVEKGLASRAEVDKMPDKEVFRFIFEAGFSTAKVVTDVSGRGVGMDVVRTNIEKLNGLIELESKVDIGTTLTIKLPLTLAILQGLLIESDKEIFILPLSSVVETVKTAQSDISYINQRPVLRLRNEIIPVVNLPYVLRNDRRGLMLAEKPYIVVIGLADQKLGVNMDKFLGQEEVVIKSLGTYLGTTEGVAGATILGDGRIRLIIDLIGLFNLAKKLS
jgi:two-component system, chemotaxis family, sensor kinase CheA